jgi:LCP family protein required for cell wall assembly
MPWQGYFFPLNQHFFDIFAFFEVPLSHMDIVRRPKNISAGQDKSPLDALRPKTRSNRAEEIYITPNDMERMQRHEREFAYGRLAKKISLFLLATILILALAYTAYFLWKAHSVSKKMNSQANTSFVQDVRSMMAPIIPSSAKPLAGQDSGRINILLLGAAGPKNPGGNLTDTIMVMSIDTAAKKIALLSVPRDLYVNIPGTSSYTKINSLYKIGLDSGQGADLIKQAMENITGIKINYYLAIDFDAFKQVIDDVGGVNVMVAHDLYDARYPGPNYSYETFSITAGFHSLDGSTALQYVRERHSDPQGDFGRALRQQQVIQAVKSKLFSMDTFFNVIKLNDVLNTLGDDIKTNVTFDDIDSFIKLSRQLDTQNITNVVVDAWKPDSLLKASHVQIGNSTAFILVPRVGNYSEIQDLGQNIFQQDELKKRALAISDENAKIGIINESGDDQLAAKIQQLLTGKLGMKNAHVIYGSPKETTADTTVSDNSNGTKIFTLDELIKKIPARLESQGDSLASGGTTGATDDITLTLGQDIDPTYSVPDATIDEYNQAQDQENNF